MDVSSIYVHDGTLIRVVEEPEQARLTMEVELPILPQEERLEPRLLVFEDVYGYRVAEGCINGCPTLLDLSVVGQEGRWTRVRLDTTVGHREILCASVRVCERHEKAEHAAPGNGAVASVFHAGRLGRAVPEQFLHLCQYGFPGARRWLTARLTLFRKAAPLPQSFA